ncbi:MAG: TlpA disulfide reductase family protein [Thermaerobacter sp.]|nr:TlpA disulfide reductase family protein [Thermaerobacter sp.]
MKRSSRKPQTVRYFIIGIIAALLVGGAIAYAVQVSTPPVTVPLVATSGKQVNVVLSGKPTVVIFFATWCPYCAYDAKWVMPEFAKKVKQAGGQVIGVQASLQLGQGIPGPKGNPQGGQDGSHYQPAPTKEQSMSIAELKRYEKVFHLDYPLFFDPGLHYTMSMGVSSYPSFAFFNSSGKFVSGLEGAQPESALWQRFQKAAQ